jgi:hypothetical protein
VPLASQLCAQCEASALLSPLLVELVRRAGSPRHAALLLALLAVPALPAAAAAAAAVALLDALTEEQVAADDDTSAVRREALAVSPSTLLHLSTLLKPYGNPY